MDGPNPTNPLPPADGGAPGHGAPLPPPAAPAWRLVRARRGVVAGVCAGISGATGVDVTLVRLAFVAAGLTGVGIVLYILLAVLLPREDPAAGRSLVAAPRDTATWLRVALVAVSLLSLIWIFGGPWRHGFVGVGVWPWQVWRGAWLGAALVLLGVGVIWLRRRQEGAAAPKASGATAPSPSGTATVAGGPLPAPVPAWWEARPQETPAGPAPTTAPRRSTPVSLILARIAGWLMVIAALLVGIALIVLERVDALSVPVPWFAIVAGVAAIVGLAVAAVMARSAWMIFAAMAGLLVPLVLVSTLATWRGGVGDRQVAPASLAELQPEYRLAIGRLTLDLSHVGLNGQTVPVEARTRLGALEVVVPSDASVDVTAHVAAGSTRVLGRQDDGLGVHQHVVDTVAAPAGTLRLDLDVAAGLIRVCRRPTPTSPPMAGCVDVLSRTGASA